MTSLPLRSLTSTSLSTKASISRPSPEESPAWTALYQRSRSTVSTSDISHQRHPKRASPSKISLKEESTIALGKIDESTSTHKRDLRAFAVDSVAAIVAEGNMADSEVHVANSEAIVVIEANSEADSEEIVLTEANLLEAIEVSREAEVDTTEMREILQRDLMSNLVSTDKIHSLKSM
jgi:hypothetical protein